MTWSVRIAEADYERLSRHLHRGDGDEHAAFLFAGHVRSGRDDRLLVHRVVQVADEDFGHSDRGGYRQVSARAVARAAIDCEAHGLRLLWAHNHPGATSRVAFSGPDRATHGRAHPHMIEMTGGRPVGSLVFGTASVAGEIWCPDGTRSSIERLDVVGARFMRLTASPREAAPSADRFDRQVRMFGPAGQAALAAMKVAVVGAGGGGSLITQTLAHLGVGHIALIDFDRVVATNLSRNALVLVGWRRAPNGRVTFIACDDQVGPYEEIPYPFTHYRAPWHSIVVPLPPKVFLTGEAAENDAYESLRGVWTADAATKPLADALAAGDIQLRTRLKHVRGFKREIAEQTSSDDVLRAIRLSRLPHFLWVVEAHLRVACGHGDCVMATLLYDATSSDYEPRQCIIAVPGAVGVFDPEPAARNIVPAGSAPWRSMLNSH